MHDSFLHVWNRDQGWHSHTRYGTLPFDTKRAFGDTVNSGPARQYWSLMDMNGYDGGTWRFRRDTWGRWTQTYL